MAFGKEGLITVIRRAIHQWQKCKNQPFAAQAMDVSVAGQNGLVQAQLSLTQKTFALAAPQLFRRNAFSSKAVVQTDIIEQWQSFAELAWGGILESQPVCSD